MNQPTYVRPASLAGVLAALQEWGERARLLAGGTDLLVRMRQGVVRPEALIDLSALDELRKISIAGERVLLGALVTHAQVLDSAELSRHAPLLVQACGEIGSVQIRARGTIGGNVINASPAGDALLALVALQADFLLLCAAGERWVASAQFFVGPGQTARRPDELLAGIRFAAVRPDERSFYQKIGPRRAVRVAKAAVAGLICLEQGRVQQSRIALGAVAPTAVRASRAEEFLSGKALTPENIEEAGRLAGCDCVPISDLRSTAAYRTRVIEVLTRRGLSAVAGQEQGG